MKYYSNLTDIEKATLCYVFNTLQFKIKSSNGDSIFKFSGDVKPEDLKFIRDDIATHCIGATLNHKKHLPDEIKDSLLTIYKITSGKPFDVEIATESDILEFKERYKNKQVSKKKKQKQKT